MPRQIVVIHGGDTYKTYDDYLAFLNDFEIDFKRYQEMRSDWKRTLREKLGDGYEVIAPDMPNKFNAKYNEWKLWFEKFIPYLEPHVILVGHSLGGTFLLKYISENKFPRTIDGLFLVAAPSGDTENYSLADFGLQNDLSGVSNQCPKIFLYHSEDDPVVPFADMGKFQKQLPGATVRAFHDRGHFNQEDFPELLTDIKSV